MLYIAGLWDPYKALKYTVHAERRIFLTLKTWWCIK